MSLVGFAAKNHPQQIAGRGTLESTDNRATTPEMFDPLNERFGFTLDAAASAHNTKLPRYHNKEANGLLQPWEGERVWCNPPFSDIRPWVEKAWSEASAPLVVLLLPANRTEQSWWQTLVEPYRDRPGSPLTVEFLPGRPRFIAPWNDRVHPNERPPFGCCLLIWSRENQPDVQRAVQLRLGVSHSGGER